MRYLVYPYTALLLCSLPAFAEETSIAEQTGTAESRLEDIEVVGVAPVEAQGVAIDKIPAHVQKADNEDLEDAQAISVADFMNRRLGSVNINDAQNNPLQPDVQYRGFTASPLLGLPQGLAVYVNGIRFNEPFGDSVNWDLIPEGAIETLTLQPGTNPVFGLNSLGGALTMRTKTGFSSPAHQIEVYGGSWDRHSEALSSGWNNGEFGYFLALRNFNDDGWRDFSSGSDVKQGLTTLSWRGDVSELNLTLASTDNALSGTGTLPQELLQISDKAVFTHPDITRNRLFLAALDGETWINDKIQLSGNMYYRHNMVRTYNGDGSEFGECEDGSGLLCDEEGEEIVALDGSAVRFSDKVDSGTINTSQATQRSFGFALQSAFDYDLLGRENHLVSGASYDQYNVHYGADTELGALTSDRGINGSGILIEDSHVRLNTEGEYYGWYFTDNWNVIDKLNVTVSGRYNYVRIGLTDQYGTSLNGKHHYSRFNPAAGLTYEFMPELKFYGSYSESSRVPTAMELSCADPNAPCKLPNAFVSDPPLKQVVSNTWETGLRGTLKQIPLGKIDWTAGFFHVVNNDDIIFQSAGGVIANAGYFANVGKTRRRGLEVGLQGDFFQRWRWSANYTYIDAQFMTAFKSHSPSNPHADADGNIQVQKGDTIPGIPQNIFKLSNDVDIVPQWTVGVDMLYNGSQVLRGDEANLTERLNGYTLFTLRSEYRFNEHVALFGRVDNLFDRRYKNFGQWGNTGSVLQNDLGIEDVNTRFYGLGAPRAGWVGIRLTL
ncbi:MAG: TonB-dependent receptor [Gammaproteobacteria bacterium]